MVFLQVVLGIFASLFILGLLRFLVFRRFRRHHHHHGRHPFRLWRALRLSRSQKQQVRSVFRAVRGELSSLRKASWSDLGALLGDTDFDRGRAEQVADHHLANLAQAKSIAIGGLERVHAILDAEQRTRVATFFSTADAR